MSITVISFFFVSELLHHKLTGLAPDAASLGLLRTLSCRFTSRTVNAHDTALLDCYLTRNPSCVASRLARSGVSPASRVQPPIRDPRSRITHVDYHYCGYLVIVLRLFIFDTFFFACIAKRYEFLSPLLSLHSATAQKQ
jgi:hypothetical protein